MCFSLPFVLIVRGFFFALGIGFVGIIAFGVRSVCALAIGYFAGEKYDCLGNDTFLQIETKLEIILKYGLKNDNVKNKE